MLAATREDFGHVEARPVFDGRQGVSAIYLGKYRLAGVAVFAVGGRGPVLSPPPVFKIWPVVPMGMHTQVV